MRLAPSQTERIRAIRRVGLSTRFAESSYVVAPCRWRLPGKNEPASIRTYRHRHRERARCGDVVSDDAAKRIAGTGMGAMAAAPAKVPGALEAAAQPEPRDLSRVRGKVSGKPSR